MSIDGRVEPLPAAGGPEGGAEVPTTTRGLDPEEEGTLDRLAELLAEWDLEDGPVDRAAVDRMIDEYGL